MSATGEGESVTAEQMMAAAEVPETEQQPQQQEKKPAKERKTKAPKEKKPKEAKTAAHPPYFQMIKEALLALNEKSGSSPYAIAKYMEERHKEVLPANFRKILALQLKNSAGRGKLIKIKASYKLYEAPKKEKAAPKTDAAKKPKEAKSTTVAPKGKAVKKSETKKKAAKPAKKVGAKKAKKATAAVKVKQPRSIRSPAAKRAKKTTT